MSAATATINSGAGFSDAVQSGFADARASVDRVVPMVTGAISKSVYTLAYGLSFGVSFPVVLVAKALPKNNSLAWGLIDGAHAAHRAVNRVSCVK